MEFARRQRDQLRGGHEEFSAVGSGHPRDPGVPRLQLAQPHHLSVMEPSGIGRRDPGHVGLLCKAGNIFGNICQVRPVADSR